MDGLRRADGGDPGLESSEFSQIEIAVRAAGAGAVAGMAAGLVWGGIGGRIAMRILFLTSDDRVRGLTSDDGFEIGTFSAATVFLPGADGNRGVWAHFHQDTDMITRSP